MVNTDKAALQKSGRKFKSLISILGDNDEKTARSDIRKLKGEPVLFSVTPDSGIINPYSILM